MQDISELSFDAFDELQNPRPETSDFDTVVDSALSRRGFLSSVLTVGAGSFVLGTSALVQPAKAAGTRFGFDAVPASTADTITVPDGYKWNMAVKWGDPLWSDAPDFDPATGGSGASQERAFGDNNDGMSLFAVDGRQVLVANNEYINPKAIYVNRSDNKPETADDIRKGKAAHGVSIVEVAQKDGSWDIIKDSPFNRRITADTPMEITGPAKGHTLMKTAADPEGKVALGTWNNCGNGETPWGTYLTCEENFNGYFSSSDEDFDVPARLKRYGVGLKDRGYAWATEDERFDISKHPNEPNRFGYVVEIDPSDPKSTPRKLTALGRFKHENADVVVAEDGRIVVYMGDDERGEYLYRFVSDGYYAEGADTSDLLTKGTLYVAKFTDDQRGEWLPLTQETTGLNDAEISIHTRQAASIANGTTMDRPEWVTHNPLNGDVYVALTNNKNRGIKTNAGGDPTPVGGPNPRAENKYGQIVRWAQDNGDHTANGFSWNIFALAGNPTVHEDAYAGSANINAANMFNSPDGISFDDKGMLWIQTDGNYSNKDDFAGMGNNQMLVADPVTGEIRRFLVGPKEAEITGVAWSLDRKTVFVGVQHPGERGNSRFPHGTKAVPHSGIVAVSRVDGGAIG